MHQPTAVWKILLLNGLVLAFFSTMLCSCGNTRHLVYMQGQFDTAKLSQTLPADPVIQKGDILSIIVYSDNPEATKIYNQTLITTATAGGGVSAGASEGLGATPSSPGYLVDENGNIEFQGLGLLHVAGLTRTVLKDSLNFRLLPFLQNPYYTIRFLNYKFTMLGEVGKPGIYSIPGDHINIFEALGLAGDMTFYGRRDNVLVIRESDGKRQFARLDLTKPEIMASPYFFLQQNDVVIFEPSKKKIAANDQVTARNISLAATLISVLAVLYGIFHH